MGGLRRRLERLEATRAGQAAELALSHLSDEDLDALEDALEAGQEDGIATFEYLYRVCSERSCRAVDALLECIETLREGREPPSSSKPGEEETSRRCNGYRIWKYGK